MGSRYRKADHKKAFKLYRELGTFYAVAQEKGMPTEMTIWRWSQSGFNCNCGYHGWDELEKKIRREVREQLENTDDISHVTEVTDDSSEIKQPNLQEFIRPDLEKLKVNRVIEKKVFNAIKEDTAASPDTLGEAMRIIHSLWREDRVILGEPTDSPKHIILTDAEQERREWAVYRMKKAQLEVKENEEEK